MRNFIVTFIALIILLSLFIAGTFTAQSGLMIAGFCLSPFVLFFLGWSASGLFAGRRLGWVETDTARRERLQERTAPANGRVAARARADLSEDRTL